jgi:hypothetical protein
MAPPNLAHFKQLLAMGVPLDQAAKESDIGFAFAKQLVSYSPTYRQAYEQGLQARFERLKDKAYDTMDELMSSEDDMTKWRAADSILRHESARLKASTPQVHVHTVLERLYNAVIKLPETPDALPETSDGERMLELDSTYSTETSLDGDGED